MPKVSSFNRIWWAWPSWLRRQIVALKIVGSNPIVHPIKKNTHLGVLFYGMDKRWDSKDKSHTMRGVCIAAGWTAATPYFCDSKRQRAPSSTPLSIHESPLSPTMEPERQNRHDQSGSCRKTSLFQRYLVFVPKIFNYILCFDSICSQKLLRYTRKPGVKTKHRCGGIVLPLPAALLQNLFRQLPRRCIRR